jgi:hypothetical protein
MVWSVAMGHARIDAMRPGDSKNMAINPRYREKGNEIGRG